MYTYVYMCICGYSHDNQTWAASIGHLCWISIITTSCSLGQFQAPSYWLQHFENFRISKANLVHAKSARIEILL